MRYTVRLFTVRPDAPASPPVPSPDRAVEAADADAAIAAASAALLAEGLRVRAISHGPGGLVAYVEERS